MLVAVWAKVHCPKGLAVYRASHRLNPTFYLMNPAMQEWALGGFGVWKMHSPQRGCFPDIKWKKLLQAQDPFGRFSTASFFEGPIAYAVRSLFTFSSGLRRKLYSYAVETLEFIFCMLTNLVP